jgi:uncharacterized protein YndB with AHSA1/START domain
MNVEVDRVIAAEPERVFAALTNGVDVWWTIRYRQASTVEIEPYVGGRLFERWEDGAWIRYATVTRVNPPVLLALAGPLGMTDGSVSDVAFILAGAKGGTLLTLIHHMADAESDEIEAAYREGWVAMLFDSLKPYIESGGAANRGPAS